MEAAEDEDSLESKLENFRFQGNSPDVDMEENYVLFIKTGESGCEKEFENIAAADDSLRIDIVQEDRNCEDIYRPRSIAVEVERELADEVDQVLFDEASFHIGE